MAPMRDAAEGSAARPGKKVSMMSAQDATDKLTASIANLDLTLKVLNCFITLWRCVVGVAWVVAHEA